MKTLMNKIGKKVIAPITGLAMLSGCAGLGAVYMQSDDPATRAWGTLMHNEGSHEQRMKESAAGRSEVNVNVGGYERQTMNQKQNYSYELINLDNYKKDIYAYGVDTFEDNPIFESVFDVYEDGKFPKKGYMVYKKKNDDIIKSYIINIETDDIRMWIIRESNKERIVGKLKKICRDNISRCF